MSETKFIRPAIVDVGFGPQPAAITYVRADGTRLELPADGRRVSWTGAEGSFWRRRLAEGGVEIVDDPKRKAEPKTSKAKAKATNPES